MDLNRVLFNSVCGIGGTHRSWLIMAICSLTTPGASPRSIKLPAILVRAELRLPLGIGDCSPTAKTFFSACSDCQNLISSMVGAVIGTLIATRYCFPVTGCTPPGETQ